MEKSDLPSTIYNLIACNDCDLLQKIPKLTAGQAAHCIRCDSLIFRNQKNSVNRSLAYAITGLLFYIIANMFPLLSLKALGFLQEGTLFSTSLSLFHADRPILSLILFLTTIVFPLTTLTGTIYILIQVKREKFNSYSAPIFRFLSSTDTWGMLEIFMLAILVSMVKLGDYADVIFGTSLYAFCLLILSMTLLSHSINTQDVWSRLRIKMGNH